MGGAFGNLKSGSLYLINGFGSTDNPFVEDGAYGFPAHVGTSWTLVAVYTPTISFSQDFGVTSTGLAYGFMEFISAN